MKNNKIYSIVSSRKTPRTKPHCYVACYILKNDIAILCIMKDDSFGIPGYPFERFNLINRVWRHNTKLYSVGELITKYPQIIGSI